MITTLKSGRYAMKGAFQNAANGNWGFAVDNDSKETVFIKEFLKWRYPPPDIDQSKPNVRSQKDKCDRFMARTKKITQEVNRVAGPDGNVVVTTDFFRDGVFLYKVTRKVDFEPWSGEDVCKHLDVTQIDRLMLGLVNAISALHAAKLLHCDLKPDNVFILKRDGQYTALISDFDDSFLVDDVPKNTEIVGTPEYMSPELGHYVSQEDDDVEPLVPFSAVSDIFAIGLIYHEYLTGELPAFSDEYSQLWAALLWGQGMTTSNKLDVAHTILIRKMLRVEPSERISSCQAIAMEIQKIIRYREKKSHILIMDGDSPAANLPVALYATYSINGEEKVKECVLKTTTDSGGVLSLKGLPEDVSYSIKYNKTEKRIVWKKERDDLSSCVLQAAAEVPKQNYTIQVKRGTTPQEGINVVLQAVKDGGRKFVAKAVTDAQGNARFNSLPQGQYIATCEGEEKPVQWKPNHTFLISLAAEMVYTVIVRRNGAPVPGAKVTLNRIAGEKLIPVEAAVADADGKAQYRNLADMPYAVTCNGVSTRVTWSAGKTFEVALPAAVERIYLIRVYRGSVPLANTVLQLFATMDGKKTHVRDFTTNAAGKVALRNPKLSKNGVPVQYSAVCDGVEQAIIWSGERSFDFVLTDGTVTISFTAKTPQGSPVPGVKVALCARKDNRVAVLKAASTNHVGLVNLGAYKPGEYFVAVQAVPEGFEYTGKLNKAKAITLPAGVPAKRFTLTMRQTAVQSDLGEIVFDKVFDPPHEGLYVQLTKYASGQTILTRVDGQQIHVNDNEMNLYGLADYINVGKPRV